MNAVETAIVVNSFGNFSVAYFWDEIGCEVQSIELPIPPGTPSEEALAIFDRVISKNNNDPGDSFSEDLGEDLQEDSPYVTYNRVFRVTNGTHVLDALVGHDKVTRVYFGEDAKGIAEMELAEWIKSH
jgi:hypothetical protein